MLNEPASTVDESPLVYTSKTRDDDPQSENNQLAEIEELVSSVMFVNKTLYYDLEDFQAEDAIQLQMHERTFYVISFMGQLPDDTEAAYQQLDDLLAPHDLFALFRDVPVTKQGEFGESKPTHLVHIQRGRINPKQGNVWLNGVLFVLTFLSVLFVGTEMAISEIAASNLAEAELLAANPLVQLWRGLPYALSILLILGAHEMGHYFVARRHKMVISLPYFIPMPFNLFGTFGAFISLRQPMKNRKSLLDIGAAGPLAGILFAVPILIIGLATSQVGNMTPGGLVEGNSILYAMSKIFVFGHFLPDGTQDVYVNQLAWAGWTGLLVTAINLIPIGQLDGGHVVYALFGERARKLFRPIIAAIVFLLLFVSNLWVLLLLLYLLIGRFYAVPLDNITPLDVPRRRLAWLTLVVFVLVFVPAPLTVTGEQSGLLAGLNTASIGALAVVVYLSLRRVIGFRR